MPCRVSAVHIQRTISALSQFVIFQLTVGSVDFQLSIHYVKFQPPFFLYIFSPLYPVYCSAVHYVPFQTSIQCTVAAIVTLRAVSATHPICCFSTLFTLYPFNRPPHVLFQSSE